MAEICYRFNIRIGSFEFEVEGDRDYVERTLTRYEGRFLPKFQQLLEKLPSAEATLKATPQGVAEELQAASRKKAQPASDKKKERPKKGPSRSDKTGRRKSDRRRTRRSNSSRVMSAPTLPSNQEVLKQPYIPPEDFEVDEETIPPPMPLTGRTTPDSVKPPAGKDEAAGAEGSVAQEDRSDKALKKFFEELEPRTHHEKIMVFGYFLQEQRGKKEFGTGKIRSCYEAASADPAGNISQVLNHATRTGFVIKALRGRTVKYSLTSKGRQFVERGLQKNLTQNV